MKTSLRTCGGVAALVWMLAGASRAELVIYSDNFDRSGTLNASSPTVSTGQYGGTGTATWTANTGITSNGTAATFSQGQSAYLPFTPVSGNVYTLTMTSDLLGDWGGMGFVNSPNVNANINELPGNKTWLLYQNDVATLLVPPGGSSPTGSSGYNTMSLALDTTGASWTVRGSFNGTPFGTTVTLPSTSLGYIALSGAYGGVNMNTDSMSLTVNAVPEPPVWALLGSGLIPLACRRWRRPRG